MFQAIVKSAALDAVTEGLLTLEILILACIVAGAVTVQALVPVFVAGDPILLQVAPESLDSSIFTPPLKPTAVQVMLWLLPLSQVSPPFGEIKVIAGGSAPVIVKSASLVSETRDEWLLETFILA
jgi:hypothetical protein